MSVVKCVGGFPLAAQEGVGNQAQRVGVDIAAAVKAISAMTAKGALAGMLTFREVIRQIVKNGGQAGTALVRDAMDAQPLTCTGETDIDDVRRMMLEHHARYMPVMDGAMLMGVISFYDVAKAVVDGQNFENKMLKAYIRDWPDGSAPESEDVKL